MNFIYKLLTARPLITCLVIGAIFMSVWWLKFQKKLNMKWYWAPILSGCHIVLGLVFVKFWALLEVGFDSDKAANMRLYGAVFLLPLIYYLGARLFKKDVKLVMDISAVCTVIGLLCGRVNCLIVGCCRGSMIVSGEELRWPIVEMEILLYIILVLYFWQRIYRRQTKGRACPTIIAVYGVFRFVAEWVREEYTGKIWVFHFAHIWSILAVVCSVTAICLINSKNVKLNFNPNKRFEKEAD